MSQILLLNTSFEPLGVITRRRALSLIARGRVEAACHEEVELRGVSTTMRIPIVLRLQRYVNVPKRRAHWSRRAVLQRDGFTCAYCGVRVGKRRRGKTLTRHIFTIDHVIPLSRGGKSTWSNTVCACPQCNQRKANRTPHEANMKLLWEPKRPRVNYLVMSGEIPAAWKIYLEV